MITICECPPDQLRQIAQSDRCTLHRCAACGTYWIRADIDEQSRPAIGGEIALAEMVTALARLKLPTATQAGHRRAMVST